MLNLDLIASPPREVIFDNKKYLIHEPKISQLIAHGKLIDYFSDLRAEIEVLESEDPVDSQKIKIKRKDFIHLNRNFDREVVKIFAPDLISLFDNFTSQQRDALINFILEVDSEKKIESTTQNGET